MDKHVFDFINPGFSAASSEHCALNVVVGTEGFSLLATGKNAAIQALKYRDFANPGRDFRDVETAVRTVFGSETIFSFPYASVHCAFFNLNATLVPRRLFTPDDLPAYFKLLLHPAEFTYHSDHLPEFDCYLIYAVEPEITRMCEQYFPNATLSHLATGLLKNWQRMAPSDHYKVFLNVRNQAAQVAVFDRQNLLLYNAFPFRKASDLLYFVLLAYEQFRLDPMETALTVSGHIAEDSENFRLLYRYVQTIRLAPLPGFVALPESAANLPEHFWFDLFCLQSFPITANR
ncbi:MAG: DUF3822 family protein [Haliscomenobacteraceae bacterium CHB4]|nr:hypothetical protein [Saprospiraceae bacterium]MCE7921917.1 DUF3822 family protein [Haliscomenobacteraceae bacterium CHB4]